MFDRGIFKCEETAAPDGRSAFEADHFKAAIARLKSSGCTFHLTLETK
jgi:hypothetical protein